MDDSWIDGPEHISECGGCDSWCEACCDVNENAYQEWLKNEKAKVETQKEKDGLANLTAKAIYLKDKKPITTAYLREVRDANLEKNVAAAETNVEFWTAKLDKAREEGKTGQNVTSYLRGLCDSKRVLLKELRAYMKETIPSKKM